MTVYAAAVLLYLVTVAVLAFGLGPALKRCTA